jgi:hypothetical protein
MATKLIVCPECQAAATPGRYACLSCGALLASVSLDSRPLGQSVAEWLAAAPAKDHAAGTRELIAERESTPDAHHDDWALRSTAGPPPPPVRTQALAAEPIASEPSARERWDDEPASVERTAGVTGELSAEEAPVEPAPAPDLMAIIRDSTKRSVPPVNPAAKTKARPTPRRRRPDAAALEQIAPLVAPAPPGGAALDQIAEADLAAPGAALAAEDAATGSERDPVGAVGAAGLAEPPLVAAQPVPGWPPPGDQGPVPLPAGRAPAGSYLPPSAVLPPSGALPRVMPTAPRNGQSASGPGENASRPDAKRGSDVDRLAQLGLPADTPRRLVAIGAVVAGLGFLLPWADVLAGSGLLGDYWTQWGLAGPGHWIVVLLLVGLASLALAGGRFADVPVGLPSAVIAALLVGLSWPYLFGFLDRGVGVWVVLAGAVLVAAGAMLDLRAVRHDDRGPTV